MHRVRFRAVWPGEKHRWVFTLELTRALSILRQPMLSLPRREGHAHVWPLSDRSAQYLQTMQKEAEVFNAPVQPLRIVRALPGILQKI